MTGSVTRNKHNGHTSHCGLRRISISEQIRVERLGESVIGKLIAGVLVSSQVEACIVSCHNKTYCSQRCMTSIDNKIHYGNICKRWKNTSSFIFKLSFHCSQQHKNMSHETIKVSYN